MSTAYPEIQYTRDEDVAIPAGFRELEEGEVILATDQVYDHHENKWEAVTTSDRRCSYGAEAGSEYRAEVYNSTIRHTGAPASFTRDEKRPIPAGFRELEEGETVLVTDLVHDDVSVSGVSWQPHTTLPAGDYRLKGVGNRYRSAGNRQRIRATSIYTSSTGTTAPAADVFPPAIPPAGWRYARIGDKLEAGRLDLAAYLRKRVSPGTSRVEPSNRTDLITADLFAGTQGPDSLGVFLIKDDRPALPAGYRYLNPGDVIVEGDEYLDRYFPGQGADLTGRWVRSLWAGDKVTAASATYRRLVQPAATPTPAPTALESALAANAALIQLLTEARARVSTLDRTNAQLEASLKIRDGRVDVLEVLLREATERAAQQTARADSAAGQVRHAVTKLEIRDDLIAILSERLAVQVTVAPFPMRFPDPASTVTSSPGILVMAGNPSIGKTFLTPPESPRDAEVNELKERIQQFESNQVKWHAFWAAFRDLHAIQFYITTAEGRAQHEACNAYGNLRRAFDACTTNPGGRT